MLDQVKKGMLAALGARVAALEQRLGIDPGPEEPSCGLPGPDA